MRARRLGVVAILAGALATIILLLLARSFLYSDAVYLACGRRLTVAVFSMRGQVDLWWSVDGHRPPNGYVEYASHAATPTALTSHMDGRRWLGFGYWNPTSYQYRWVSAPHWFFVLMSGVTCAIAIRRSRKLCRVPGFCCVCGYDLRATPGRCPECGTPAQETVHPR